MPEEASVEQSVEYVSLLQDPNAADTVNQILGSVEGKELIFRSNYLYSRLQSDADVHVHDVTV